MPVNLLVVVPTVVAVSSTVENKTILPEHLVDGKLDTAWNSRTNELAGAWVAVRVPREAKVTEIKLTAGFTKVDKKLGDLFTMNPRIKRVRITHDGWPVLDKELDVESRALQSIPVDEPGGDFKIEVLEFVPGTKDRWREMPISELEVWGTPPANAKLDKVTPVVRVGSLEPQSLTLAECLKVLPLGDDSVLDYQAIDLSGGLVACAVAHKPPYAMDGVASIAIVKRGPKPSLVAKLPDAIAYEHSDGGMGLDQATVTLSALDLTTTEQVLRVETGTHISGPMHDEGKTTVTSYRVVRGAAVPILAVESEWAAGESGSGTRCELDPFAAGDKPPEKLSVTCTTSHSGYPGDKSDKDWSKTKTLRYRWNGTRYK